MQKEKKGTKKKFRVAKCLADGKILDFVIFDDGTRRLIEIDENGNQYFRVGNNYFRRKKDVPDELSFIGRIGDAIQSIRDGNGDTIVRYDDESCSNDRHALIGVAYYIDRTIGEQYRLVTLRSWENSKCMYVVTYGTQSYDRVALNEHVETEFDDCFFDPVRFETESEAEEWATQLIRDASNFAKDYVKLVGHHPNPDMVIQREIIGLYGGTTCRVLFQITRELALSMLRSKHFPEIETIEYTDYPKLVGWCGCGYLEIQQRLYV